MSTKHELADCMNTEGVSMKIPCILVNLVIHSLLSLFRSHVIYQMSSRDAIKA